MRHFFGITQDSQERQNGTIHLTSTIWKRERLLQNAGMEEVVGNLKYDRLGFHINYVL